jgi:hypothetical protein
MTKKKNTCVQLFLETPCVRVCELDTASEQYICVHLHTQIIIFTYK